MQFPVYLINFGLMAKLFLGLLKVSYFFLNFISYHDSEESEFI